MIEFRKLGIIEPILQSITEFKEPTEIQKKTIPLCIQGKDVIAGSATGSGKTLAFGAGIIQHSEKGKGIQALVLTPTRELAEQIKNALIKFSRFKHLKIICVYGGVGLNPQIDGLRSADVVIGTPGRTLDHLSRNTINLRNVKILVLDEADRMLDMGFIEDVEKIIRQCPRERQTLLFSATIPLDIATLAHKHMKHPIKVSAEAYVDPKKLAQCYYDVQDNLKFSLLVHLIKHENAKLIMVFSNSRKTTDFVAKNLKKSGVDAIGIHGGLSQARRNKVMEHFHSQNVHVLVCTDVAARGLDIQGVSHVYNYDIPKESKQYIHRIGRTARAGKEGKAVNLVSGRDYDNFSRVLRDYDVNIVKQETPRVERVNIMRTDRPRGGFSRSYGHGAREGRGYRSSGDSGQGYREGHGSGFRSNRGQGYSGRPRKDNAHGSRGYRSGAGDRSHYSLKKGPGRGQSN